MNVIACTRAYEAWLKRQVDIVHADLRQKHEEMEASAFVFLRGTFYRWAQIWPTVCPKAAAAPIVTGVGDLHLENFGTWRDAEGRLVWGINDFDEAYPLPYTNDLVRLATSARLAAIDGELTLSARQSCRAILDGYRAALQRRGRPIVLAERNRWLGTVAAKQLRNPRRFWKGLQRDPDAARGAPLAVLRAALPKGQADRITIRRAGVGSLGRPRFVALHRSTGAFVAREAKALIPSAAGWAAGAASPRIYARDVLAGAVRVPDPFLQILDRWVVRRLAPDCTKVEAIDFPNRRDEARLLRAMGWETANVHLASRCGAVLRDLEHRRAGWLERASAAMEEATLDDFRTWRRR